MGAASSPPAKVLHVISTLVPGGAEFQVAGYVRELRRQGVDAHICVIREKGAIYAELEREGVPLTFLKFRSRWHPLSLWQLTRLIRDGGFTHVQGHMYRANVPATVAAVLARRPAILTTIHDYWDNDKQRLMDARLNRFRDRVLVVSREKWRSFVEGTGIAPERCLLFPSAIDVERARSGSRSALRGELGLDGDVPLIGMIARTAEPKDYPAFIRAAERFLAIRPEAMFIAVGDGRMRAALEAQAGAGSKLLRQRFRFMGTRFDVPDILAALDVFVLSTKMEGMPLAVLEAMAAGVPVVTTPVGGIPEVVRDGETGWTFPVGDDAALAERIGLALAGGQDGVLTAARRLVDERYGLVSRTRELIALYHQIARER